MIFNNVLVQFAALAGFAAFASMLIGALKLFGVISDGNSAKWSLGINFVGIMALYVYKLFVPATPLVGSIDSDLAEAATVGLFVVSFVGQLGISKLTYFVTKNLPVIGFTHNSTLPTPDPEKG